MDVVIGERGIVVTEVVDADVVDETLVVEEGGMVVDDGMPSVVVG